MERKVLSIHSPDPAAAKHSQTSYYLDSLFQSSLEFLPQSILSWSINLRVSIFIETVSLVEATLASDPSTYGYLSAS